MNPDFLTGYMRLSAEALIDSQNWLGDLHPQPTFAAHCTRQHRLAEIVARARVGQPQRTPRARLHRRAQHSRLRVRDDWLRSRLHRR